MVIVLKGSERQEKRDCFEKLFRLRHQIFVKGRGWSLPSANGYEIDQYDTDEAVYFIDINEEDVIEGSVRVTPTEKSSLLADYFPHLVENGEPPRSPHIYECTRYIILPSRKSREDNRMCKVRLVTAMLEWGIRNNLSFLQTVIDTGTLSSFLEMTPLVIPLGLSHPYGGGRGTPGGGECMAIRWPCSLQVLDDVHNFGGLNVLPENWPELGRVDQPVPSQLMH